MQRNARFWVWHGFGWVKLTLRPWQSLETFRSSRHEEGWSSESCRWTHGGDGVIYEHATDGCDCDGRLSNAEESYCPLDALGERDMFAGWDYEENKGIFAPAWRHVDSSRRDYAAEAAGY